MAYIDPVKMGKVVEKIFFNTDELVYVIAEDADGKRWRSSPEAYIMNRTHYRNLKNK